MESPTRKSLSDNGDHRPDRLLLGALLQGAQTYYVKSLTKKVESTEGRLKYFLRDDSYQPAKTKAIAKEFVEQIGVFAVVGGVGVAPGMTARDYLMENQVFWFSPDYAEFTSGFTPFKNTLFALYPLYDDEAFNLTGYLHEKLGFKKIAMFYQNDDYGKQGVMGVERYLLKT